jgi:hemerythrin
MSFNWNKDLETGYAEIDDQHHEIIAIVDSLKIANRLSWGSDEIFAILSYLINTANRHFRDEEAIQIMCHYPDYDRHRICHNEFKKKINELALILVKDGITKQRVNDVIAYVELWMQNHIRGDDFAMASYVQMLACS